MPWSPCFRSHRRNHETDDRTGDTGPSNDTLVPDQSPTPPHNPSGSWHRAGSRWASSGVSNWPSSLDKGTRNKECTVTETDKKKVHMGAHAVTQSVSVLRNYVEPTPTLTRSACGHCNRVERTRDENNAQIVERSTKAPRGHQLQVRPGVSRVSRQIARTKKIKKGMEATRSTKT